MLPKRGGDLLLIELAGRVLRKSGIGLLLRLRVGVHGRPPAVNADGAKGPAAAAGTLVANCWNCRMRWDTLPPTLTFLAVTGFAGLRNGEGRAVSATTSVGEARLLDAPLADSPAFDTRRSL
jgi:hypothetical protein